MSGTVGDNTARASGVVASAGGGAVLQVKSVQVTNTISVGTSATPVAMTAFDIAFTPTAATSVLCLQLSMQAGNPGSGTGGYFYDSTGAAIIPPYADSGGSRQQLTFAQAVYNTTRSEGITIQLGLHQEMQLQERFKFGRQPMRLQLFTSIDLILIIILAVSTIQGRHQLLQLLNMTAQ